MRTKSFPIAKVLLVGHLIFYQAICSSSFYRGDNFLVFLGPSTAISLPHIAPIADLNEARKLLMDQETSTGDKKRAIRHLRNYKGAGALNILSEALLRFRGDEELAISIIEAVRHLRQTGVLKKRRLGHDSIIGTLWRAIEEFGLNRDNFTLVVDNPYDSLKLKFSFPPGNPFYQIDRVIARIQELYTKKNAHINAVIDYRFNEEKPEKTEGEISIRFKVTMANLTDFWRVLETLDYRTDSEGRYRVLTTQEIIEKVKERTLAFLEGIDDRNSQEYRELFNYVYGDGNPGLIRILMNPDRYGDLQFIRVESSQEREQKTDRPRSGNRTSLNELLALAKYNPYFAHSIPEDGIQRWIYLARAAGSIFMTADIKARMRGHAEADYMFFVSKDTMGPTRAVELNTQISKLTGWIPHHDPEWGEEVTKRVANFTAVKLAMMNWLRQRYYAHAKVAFGAQEGIVKFRRTAVWRDGHGNRYEIYPIDDRLGKGAVTIAEIKLKKSPGELPPFIEEAHHIHHGERRPFGQEERLQVEEQMKSFGFRQPIVYPSVINTLYNQLKATPILAKLRREDEEGNRIVPKVCVIDEVADGSWDFLLKYTLEEKSRMDEEDGFEEGELRRKTIELLGGKDLWWLRSADVYSLNQRQIEDWDRLERAIHQVRQTKESVDVEIFIGSPRSPGAQNTPGYPSIQKENLMRDYQMSEAEAEKAIRSTTEGADFVPHSFMVDAERSPVRPIYDDVPIELETRAVQLSAYLKALLLYNGVVEYYEREYKRVGLQPLLDLIRAPEVSPGVKEIAIRAVSDFIPPADIKENLTRELSAAL